MTMIMSIMKVSHEQEEVKFSINHHFIWAYNNTITDFPVQGAMPGKCFVSSITTSNLNTLIVDVIDGTKPFVIQNIRTIAATRDLPKTTKELPDWTPVLVTCTIAINDWDPKLGPDDKEGPKSPSKKRKDGFKKSVSFNLQNIVELGPPGVVNDIEYDIEDDKYSDAEEILV